MYDRFEDLLKRKGLKVADLSRLTGLSSTVFSEWKSGKSIPKTDKLIKIAKALDTTVEYLVTGENEQANPLYTNEQIEQAMRFLDQYEAASPEIQAAILTLLKSRQ